MSVKINLTDVKHRLATIEDLLEHPPMAIITRRGEEEVFNNLTKKKKNKDGSSWKLTWKKGDKEHSTRQTKRGGNKMLEDTGGLRTTLNHSYTAKTGRVWSGKDYAGYHQNGQDGMKRQFMYVGEEFEAWEHKLMGTKIHG